MIFKSLMNGHANYETWLTHVWEIPTAIADSFEEDYRPDAKYCHEWVQEYLRIQDMEASYLSDLINSALDNVKWYEIADSVNEILDERKEDAA